jgi:hypothetical protein
MCSSRNQNKFSVSCVFKLFFPINYYLFFLDFYFYSCSPTAADTLELRDDTQTLSLGAGGLFSCIFFITLVWITPMLGHLQGKKPILYTVCTVTQTRSRTHISLQTHGIPHPQLRAPRSRRCGNGYWRVWARARKKMPAGDPCSSLATSPSDVAECSTLVTYLYCESISIIYY